MKKDKKWLLDEIRNLPYEVQRGYRKVKLADIFPLINQLDEPEVLSKEWINKHITDGHNVNLGDKVIYADDLDGVIVPKQELPVIPNFVDDWRG